MAERFPRNTVELRIGAQPVAISQILERREKARVASLTQDFDTSQIERDALSQDSGHSTVRVERPSENEDYTAARNEC